MIKRERKDIPTIKQHRFFEKVPIDWPAFSLDA